jgi:hypothetical protein
MPETHPSMPPSDPRPSAVTRVPSAEISAGGLDRPARIQMVVALVLGLALVAIPLYLWRRPRSEGALGPEEAKTAAAAVLDASPAVADAAPPAVVLSEAVVLECHDSGSRRTSPDQCDHVAAVEKALAHAIEESASCVPTSSGGGVLPFVADISFARKRNPIQLTIGKDGRTLKGAKVSGACATAVKHALGDLSLDGMAHAHGRYKVQIVATYPSAPR